MERLGGIVIGSFRWNVLFMVVLLPLVAACGSGQYDDSSLPEPRGVVQQSDEHPYAVIVLLPSGAGLCSGARIAEDLILTAAHCTSRAGTYIIRNSYFYATGTVYARNSAGNLGDPRDIALIRITNITRDDVPSDLPRIASVSTRALSQGEALRLTGAGCDDVVDRTGVGIIRTGTNNVAYMDSFANFVTPRNLAHRVAGPSNRAASCSGDSGGSWVTEDGDEAVSHAVVHAGGYNGNQQLSQAAPLSNPANASFLAAAANAGFEITFR